MGYSLWNLRNYLPMTISELRVKQCLPSIISNVTNNKWALKNCYKFSNTTIAIRFNLVQVSPSLPPFVLAMLFVHSFHVLSGYICFTRFGGGSHWLNFEKEFRDTAPLMPLLYLCSSWWIHPLLLLACATDQLNSGEVRLQNSAEILVLGLQLCTRIWVRAMIGVLKMPLLICQSGWREMRNVFPVVHWVRWGARNKDIGAASQTLLTDVKLRLQRSL